MAEYLNDKKASVTVEIYRHKSPANTFGIYSQEYLPEGNFLKIWTQAYMDKNILDFLSGSYVGFNVSGNNKDVIHIREAQTEFIV